MSQNTTIFEDIKRLDEQNGEILFSIGIGGQCSIDSFLDLYHSNEAAIKFVLYRLFDDIPYGFIDQEQGIYPDYNTIEGILGCDKLNVVNRQAKYFSQKERIDHIISQAVRCGHKDVAGRFIEEFGFEYNHYFQTEIKEIMESDFLPYNKISYLEYTDLDSLWEKMEEGAVPLDQFFANYLYGKDDEFVEKINGLLLSQIENAEIDDEFKQVRKEYLLMLTMNNKSWDSAHELFNECGFSKDHMIGDLTFLGHMIKGSIGDGGSEDEDALSLIARIVVAKQNAPEYVCGQMRPEAFADSIGADIALKILSGALPFRFLDDYDIDPTAWLGHQFRILEQIARYQDINALKAMCFLIKSGLGENSLFSILPYNDEHDGFWGKVSELVVAQDPVDLVSWVEQQERIVDLTLVGNNESSCALSSVPLGVQSDLPNATGFELAW